MVNKCECPKKQRTWSLRDQVQAQKSFAVETRALVSQRRRLALEAELAEAEVGVEARAGRGSGETLVVERVLVADAPGVPLAARRVGLVVEGVGGLEAGEGSAGLRSQGDCRNQSE